MQILFQYIFKKLGLNFAVISPIVVMVVWLALSVRYINLIITDDVDFSMFAKLIAFTLPDIASIILPVCFIISSIYVFYKLQNDMEITVMMASGASKFAISSPLLVFSVILSLFLLFIQTTMSPISYRHLNEVHHQIQSKVSMTIIKSNTFNIVGDSVIYIRQNKNNNSLENIFISHKNNIISAKSGSYKITNDNKLLITLQDGFRQEIDQNNEAISTLRFERFSYDVTEFVKRYSHKIQKPHEKTQSELFSEARTTNDKNKRTRLLSEAHGRYVSSIIPVINSLLIALFIVGRGHNNVRRRTMCIKSFVSCLVAQTLFMVFISSSNGNEMLITFNYILAAASILVLACANYIEIIRRAIL